MKTGITAYLATLSLSFMLSGCGMFSQSAFVDTGPAPVKAKQIVKTACSQVGKKYRSGGASPQKGFDCSGLVWWSYRQNGIKVPRITTDQARTGKSVPKKLARPGDIMVFRINRSPRGLHTGLYTGGGKFIHSPTSGKRVCLEKLSADSFWNKNLISVRRVVKQ